MAFASTATLELELIQQARERIAGKVHRTPVMRSATLDERLRAQVYFKCENFQKGGAFKARGATNAVFSLAESDACRGVATHSSGNHGAALARAARLRGIPAHVVMPETAPQAKQAAVARYGATIVRCAPTLKAREAALERLVAERGAVVVHPYNDLNVMAGQGTLALELLEDLPGLEAIICPVGGGGLLGGIATAAAGRDVRVVGVEPALADDAARSLAAGHIVPSGDPPTIADGLRASLGPLTFAAIRRHAAEITSVSEESIVAAMRLCFEVLKIVVEPSAAVGLAALIEHKLDVRGRRVAVVLSGGNLDLERLPWSAAATRQSI